MSNPTPRERAEAIVGWEADLPFAADMPFDVEERIANIERVITAAEQAARESERAFLNSTLGVFGTDKCPLCDSCEPHDHPVIDQGCLGICIALNSVKSLHAAAAIVSNFVKEREQAAFRRGAEAASKLCFRIARPWVDGKLTYEQWDAAFNELDSILDPPAATHADAPEPGGAG